MKLPIKKYVDDPSLSWEERYYKLLAHHEDETILLLERIDAVLHECEGGQVDGAHHKAYTIDQIVRILLGCPAEVIHSVLVNGQGYMHSVRVPNKAYEEFVGNFRRPHGEDEDIFLWEEGIP